MNRRDAFALRNTNYTQLNTRRDEYGNGFESEYLYESAGFAFDYVHEWTTLPESVWGYPVLDVASAADGRTLIVVHGTLFFIDPNGTIEQWVDIPGGSDGTYEVSMARDGRIWISAVDTGELMELDSGGNKLGTFHFSRCGSGVEQVLSYIGRRNEWCAEHGGKEFFMPRGMAEDTMDRIWFCDEENDQVIVYDEGSGRTDIFDDFFSAADVASGEKYVYVLEADGRISICDVNTLKIVAQIGFWQCQDIIADSIDVDREGNLYLTDPGIKCLFKLKVRKEGRKIE